MKKVIWSIVLSWVCLAFAAAGIGTRDAVSACDGKVYKKGDKIMSLRFPDICLLGRLQRMGRFLRCRKRIWLVKRR